MLKSIDCGSKGLRKNYDNEKTWKPQSIKKRGLLARSFKGGKDKCKKTWQSFQVKGEHKD